MAHIVSIRRFSNAALGTPADREAIEKSAVSDYPDNFVKRILAHRRNPNDHEFEFKIRWLGFDQGHDSWEPATNIAEAAPDLTEEYLRAHPDQETNRFLRRYFT